tara:strand:+ start:12266 stop:12532 length:267 start_codon:yes stop_codon:yes gene_type:complete
MDKGERKKRIEKLLMDNFSPKYINVVDDSISHIGHIGYQEGGETHYNIEIESEAFLGKNRVERERMVSKLLEKEFQTGLHALSLKFIN